MLRPSCLLKGFFNLAFIFAGINRIFNVRMDMLCIFIMCAYLIGFYALQYVIFFDDNIYNLLTPAIFFKMFSYLLFTLIFNEQLLNKLLKLFEFFTGLFLIICF